SSLHATFAPAGGALVVVGYQDESIRVFNADGDREIRRFAAEPGTDPPKKPRPWWDRPVAALAPGGKILATCRTANSVELWDVASGKKLHTLVADAYYGPSILLFSPD